MYRLASWTTRIASLTAARLRWVPSSPPTLSKPADVVASSPWSTGCSSPGAGISPKFLWIRLAVRLTRLPQPATSSELVRVLKSAHVKSESWFSGPATDRK